MASVERLRIVGLRNLERVDIGVPDGMVWLAGPNGSGKTSVLEAIYVVSRGVSFRGRRHGPLTSHGARGTRIDGWIGQQGGVARRSWTSRDGHESAGEVARFGVRLIGSSMQALIEGEPALRRRFVDWNVFHVEPAFGTWRRRFRRAAAQRNAWLRGGARGRAIWDEEYSAALQVIAEARAGFVGRLAGEFRRVAEGFGLLSEVVPVWRSGLPMDESLPRALAAQLEGDVSRGYTYLSATRADLTLMRDGRRWIGSRGQNKLAGILLQLAAERCCRSIEYECPVWLVDDPSAELDTQTVDAVLPMIAAAGDQILVASLSPPSGRIRDCCRPSLFHVEQGSVSARRVTPPRDL